MSESHTSDTGIEPSGPAQKGVDDILLTKEAEAAIQAAELEAPQRDLVHLFALQSVRQTMFWESDVRVSETQLDREVFETPIDCDVIEQAIADVLNPEIQQKRLFLLDYVASEGDLTKIHAAYDARKKWEAENSTMTFTQEDVAPYRLHIIRVFDRVFKQTKEGDGEAVEVLRMIVADFRNVPGADYEAWLLRRVAESLPNDLQMIQAKDAVRNDRAKFSPLVDAFLRGEQLPDVRSLTSGQ